MKKKILISVSIWIIIFGVVFTIFDPFNIKKLIGQANKDDNIKNLFKDEEMYYCVLSAYFDYYFSDENMYFAMSDFYSTYEGTIDMVKMYETMAGVELPLLKLEDISKITDLSCDNVSDTSGIEYMPNLTRVTFYNGTFKKLDLTNQKKLDYLYINNSLLSDLDINSNEKLRQLDISSEKLIELDLSNKPMLNHITLNTKIKNLDLTDIADNARLTSNNRFEELKVLNSFARKNSVTSLSKNTKIYERTQLESGDTKLEKIEEIDYTGSYKIGETHHDSNSYGNSWPYNSLYSDLIVTDLDISTSSIKELFKLENGSVKICNNYTNCSEEITSEESVENNYVVLFDNDGNRLDSNRIRLFNNSLFKDYYLYDDVINNYNNVNHLYFDDQKTIKDILTDEELATVTYINESRARDLTGIEKLTGLTSITLRNVQGDVDLSNNKKLTNASIYGNYSNYANNINFGENTLLKEINTGYVNSINVSGNVNLEKLSISRIKNELNLSKNTNLKELYISTFSFNCLNLNNNIGLIRLYIFDGKLQDIDLTKLVNLERLSLDIDIPVLNLNYNNKLSNLDLYGNIEEVYGLDDLILNDVAIESMSLRKIDLAGNKNINNLSLISFALEEIDLTGLNNLQVLILLSPKLKEIKGIEKLNLYAFIAPHSQIEELDLTNSTNLSTTMVSFSKLSKNKVNILKGEKISLPENFKFTDSIKTETFNEDDFIASYDTLTKEISANSYGQTTITRYYTGLDLFMGEMGYYPLKTYVRVFDIKSSKYEVNKQLGYIYVGTEDNDKAIKRYVKVYGEDVSKSLEDNKFTILSNNEKVREFDVIKVSSSKYDMNSNEIIYNGEFDIDKIKITNAKLEVIEDELQINYKGNVIRTFKLTKEEK